MKLDLNANLGKFYFLTIPTEEFIYSLSNHLINQFLSLFYSRVVAFFLPSEYIKLIFLTKINHFNFTSDNHIREKLKYVFKHWEYFFSLGPSCIYKTLEICNFISCFGRGRTLAQRAAAQTGCVKIKLFQT